MARSISSRSRGIWLRDDNGALTKATQHICWDGCMFPNETMTAPQTWNDVLSTMIAVRNAHGWDYQCSTPLVRWTCG